MNIEESDELAMNTVMRDARGVNAFLKPLLDGQRFGIEWDKLPETDQSSGIGGNLEHYLRPRNVAPLIAMCQQFRRWSVAGTT